MEQSLREALKILRRKQVEAQTGLCRSAIYQKMADGTFPQAVKLNTRTVGWIESEIYDWLKAQVESSRVGTLHKSKSGGQ